MPAKPVQRKPSTKDVSTPSNFVHTSANTESPSVSFSKAIPNPYYYNAPTTPASKPGKFFSSIKSWGKSSKHGRAGPRESVQQTLPPSSSAGSNLTSAFDWDSSSNMSYSSPDTSPEAKRRSPPRKPLNAVFQTERSATPPPQLRPDEASKQTTQSPPFDLSFERAAAVPLIESRSSSNSSLASNARLQPLTLDLPSSLAKARIPSMRFDDLTVFFRDLEEKLAFKAGEVGAMDANVLVQEPSTTRKGLRHPQHSEAHREEAAEELRQLMSQQLAGPSTSKTHERSVSASSLPYSMGPEMPLPVAPLKKAKKHIPEPIALPPTLAVPLSQSIGTPRNQNDCSAFSPRLSSQSTFGTSLFNPPELQVQPPTPVLDTGLFPLPPSRQQRKETADIPIRRSSRSPSPPVSPKPDLDEPVASTSTSTPPLSPSSSSDSAGSIASASPQSDNFPRSTSNMSLASEASDVRFSTLLDSLQRAVAPEEKEMMTEANLARHQSALSSLVDQAMSSSSLHMASTQLDEEDDQEVEELEWSEDEEDGTFQFDDAPSLRSSPSSRAVLVEEESDMGSYMSSSSLATTVSVGSLRSKKSDLLVRRRTRHQVKDSLGDIDEAVVVMCDRIEVGMAM